MSRPPSGAEPSAGHDFHPDFLRAFLAMRYFLGARGPELASALPSVSPEARAVLARLEQRDRARRAEALAVEVGQVVRALEARTFR